MQRLGQDIQATDASTTITGADVLMAKNNRAPLPSRYTSRARETRREYLKGVESGVIPVPTGDSKADRMERNSLAGLASLARWGKAPKGMRPFGHTFGITMKTSK
jgi:hypothetical protein